MPGRPLRYLQFDALTRPHFFERFEGTVQPVTRVSEMDDIAAFTRGEMDVDVAAVFSPYTRHYTFPLGVLEPIDTNRLSHWNDLFPAWQEAPEFFGDDGVRYAVPNNWGTDALIVNTDLVRWDGEDSIAILFDPSLRGRVAVPGQDGIETAAVMALSLGLADPFDLSDADLQRVEQALLELRPNLRCFWTTERELVELFAAGEVAAAWAWLPTYVELRRRGLPVRWAAPREGQILWSDGNGIIKGTQDLSAAYAFIDYLISPEYLEPLYRSTGYRTCSRVVTAMLSGDERRALQLDRPEELMAQCIPWICPPRDRAAKIREMLERISRALSPLPYTNRNQ
jgi:spermidine/putrescine-binding protein